MNKYLTIVDDNYIVDEDGMTYLLGFTSSVKAGYVIGLCQTGYWNQQIGGEVKFYLTPKEREWLAYIGKPLSFFKELRLEYNSTEYVGYDEPVELY